MIDIKIFNKSNLSRIPRKKIENAVKAGFIGEKCNEVEVRIIYDTDEAVHQLNREYLGHDYPTDVITFPLEERPLEGEIYISAETAARQAEEYEETLNEVLIRLAVHGALHLVGYDDDTDEKKSKMNTLETHYMTEENLQLNK
ncbi:MAG: rRNA maturation RNase YbeY [Ignavibacteriae bacterium]|nr:rRNA maturation RNase YbeY [Ignavibacteriota bacterium]